MSNPLLTISPEVQSALHNGEAVVALESTIITHGMPYPQNRDTALQVEKAVRDAGAIPATIAILDGQITVGLNDEQLNALAQTKEAMKLSRADLAMAVSRKAMGSTTVAATMIVAHLAGIKVFATGGIGGVHQGAESSFDISADLQELGRTPVTVICAGAKAILDIPKTLEVLETLGVPVLAYGQDEVPAFWSRSSGLQAPLRADSVDDIVAFMQAREALQLGGGVLVTNPVPVEAEIARETMQIFISQAIQESQAAGISGKAVTPWLLGRIVELSEGRSLVTNQALITNNATLSAQLAVALSNAR
ncbi:pseudouridine-5'-phosphate glycosidase [Granulosicoccus antarcticus]|uniref:Pseudouridine-5'-phosphate glycosidase n=1 Tax=Granulosicoccus antarcticus IMCC3135 TaxID=1192854 RepID=A0A2Z2NJF3_9GAMM|nr:pseudouridine-5'-phosphate glycosidase [Granulosicoccus antarcticus]ASJ71522.1 Pseudouridine-5'-phosphate glycosidase [Granulosicoccus antarcticus IMCC3135]